MPGLRGKPCTRCGGSNQSKRFLWCQRCRTKAARRRSTPEYRKYMAEHYATLRDAGLCVRCKEPAAPDRTLCREHLLVQAANNLKRQTRATEEGRCRRCLTGRPKGGNTTCQRCIDYVNEREAEQRDYFCPCGSFRQRHQRFCETCLSIGVCTERARTRDVAEVLRDAPGATVYEISEATGVSVRGCIRNLRKLGKAGMLRREQEARNTVARYWLTGELAR